MTESTEDKMRNLEKMLETFSDDIKTLKDKRFNQKMTQMRVCWCCF